MLFIENILHNFFLYLIDYFIFKLFISVYFVWLALNNKRINIRIIAILSTTV